MQRTIPATTTLTVGCTLHTWVWIERVYLLDHNPLVYSSPAVLLCAQEVHHQPAENIASLISAGTWVLKSYETYSKLTAWNQASIIFRAAWYDFAASEMNEQLYWGAYWTHSHTLSIYTQNKWVCATVSRCWLVLAVELYVRFGHIQHATKRRLTGSGFGGTAL